MFQAVADACKQQVSDVSEAALREKEAAVTKSIQSVHRRASKEALQQVLPGPLVSFLVCLYFLLQPLQLLRPIVPSRNKVTSFLPHFTPILSALLSTQCCMI